MAKALIWMLILLILVVFQFNICSCGIFSWLFTKYDDSNYNKNTANYQYDNMQDSNLKSVDTSVLSVKIPFEVKSSDEKFLNEVSKYTSDNLSELDICHHKVILSLRKSCSELTEEDLSKVAVNLLNCQSSVEIRRIYPCTETMMLSECTKDMDQNTWNAYHIISNRVRAVCYHFRQQQFTAKTEMTVNKLVHSAEEQIGAMKLLETSQSNLKDATADTLNALKSGHQVLEKQQENLSFAQVGIRNYVSSNIRDLTREKRLIASGQKELAGITLAIKKKLEEAQEQLKDQGIGQRNTHRKILKDLSDIQDGASRVWGQIDESTKAILLKHEQTVTNYNRLMDDLQKMNTTVHHLMDVMLKMKVKVEEKFSWISALVGDTDATVQKIYSFVLHICYCLLGMVAASFLQIPYATKMALIVLVPLNAMAELKNESGFEFSTLTIILAACAFCNVSAVGLSRVYRWRKVKRLEVICDSTSSSLPPPHCAKCAESFTQTTYDESSSNFLETRPETPNRSSNFDSFNDTDFTSNKYLNNSSSLKASRSYISPLTRIREENRGEEPLKDEHRSWSSDRRQMSPYSFTDSVRRRLLSTTDSDPPPPPPPPKDTSDYHSESFSSEFETNVSKFRSPRSNTSSRPTSSQSNTPKKICVAFCKSGLPCRNTVSTESSLCHRHLMGLSRESTPLR